MIVVEDRYGISPNEMKWANVTSDIFHSISHNQESQEWTQWVGAYHYESAINHKEIGDGLYTEECIFNAKCVHCALKETQDWTLKPRDG